MTGLFRRRTAQKLYGETDWTLEIHSLSNKRATRSLRLLKLFGMGRGAEIYNPYSTFHWTLDRSTAQWLRAALSDGDTALPSFAGDKIIVVSSRQASDALYNLVEDLDEFLLNGIPYPIENESE